MPIQTYRTRPRARNGLTPAEKPGMSQGFTLVELLVVIAIIAVLIAMLAPALEKAIGEAQKVNCMGNLKGMGTGFTLYAQDHKLYYPSSTGNYTVVGNVGWEATEMSNPDDPNNPFAGQPASAPSWRRPLNPYVGYPSTGDESTVMTDNAQMTATGQVIQDITVKIAICPSDVGDSRHLHNNSYEAHGSSYIAAWNGNSFRTTYVVSQFGSSTSAAKKITSLGEGSLQKKMVMADLPWRGDRHFADVQSRWHSETERGFNMLFADAHTEYVVTEPNEIEDPYGWSSRGGDPGWKWW